MNLLTRYILRQNLYLLLLVCGIGLGIYIFIDLFDRLDDFLEAGVGFASVGAYFLYRTPFILAQIFPAVFLFPNFSKSLRFYLTAYCAIVKYLIYSL